MPSVLPHCSSLPSASPVLHVLVMRRQCKLHQHEHRFGQLVPLPQFSQWIPFSSIFIYFPFFAVPLPRLTLSGAGKCTEELLGQKNSAFGRALPTTLAGKKLGLEYAVRLQP